MNVHRRRLRTAVIALATALSVGTVAVVAAGPATAAGPVGDWVTIDDTYTWGDCGFDVVEHDTGRLHFLSWFDDSGQRQRQLVLAPGSRATFTNAVTGASVSSPTPYVVKKQDYPDGSALIAFTGLRFDLRGGGTTYVDSGRDVIVFGNGSITPVSSAGPSADLCAALTAAIG